MAALQILAIAKLSLWFAPCPEREPIGFNSCNYLQDRTLEGQPLRRFVRLQIAAMLKQFDMLAACDALDFRIQKK
jgi:hypothetical protein